MTKPVVDAGRFRRVGEFVAPWPAFVVCAAPDALAAKGPAIAAVLRMAVAAAARLAASPDGAAQIASRYGLEVRDVRDWLATTRWATRPGIDAAHVAPALAALHELEIVDRALAPADMLAPLPAA